MKLSVQAVMAIMMALQKGMMSVDTGSEPEETHIPTILKSFELENTADGLIVKNPPIISLEDTEMFDEREIEEISLDDDEEEIINARPSSCSHEEEDFYVDDSQTPPALRCTECVRFDDFDEEIN